MNRRELVKSLLLAPFMLNSSLRPAEAAVNDRVLVMVFMRGGWDGLNIIVPHGEDAYYSLRPSIGIKAPSSGSPQSAIDLNGFFGLHPAMAPLHPMFDEGQVAVMPAVHYDNSSRSHFTGQDIVESASFAGVDSGWLGRYLKQAGGDPLVKAISLSDQVPLSLSGLATPVSAFSDISSLALAAGTLDQTMIGSVLSKAYAWNLPVSNPNSTALRGVGSRLLDELNNLRTIGQMPAENGAAYPNSTFARQLKQTAALIKARAGLEVIALNLSGWDTHSNQGGGEGRMSSLLATFSQSISAFFTDLGSSASRVLVLTASEFGRTAAENGSNGTDHGNATTWFAIGPAVRGGIHLGGGWPTLDKSRLVDGRALAHTIDFREVYAHVLSRFLGMSGVSSILPGFSGTQIDMVA